MSTTVQAFVGFEEQTAFASTMQPMNSAQVTRKTDVQLRDGQNTVQVKNQPSGIDEVSIRVNGVGNATIFDVIYRP